MTYDIGLYLSGLADSQTELELENAMLKDGALLERFIAASEQSVLAAPDGVAASVMQKLNSKTIIVTVPMLSRKLCAAVCFFSAAAIIVLTACGFNWQNSDFFLTGPVKLGEILSAITSIN